MSCHRVSSRLLLVLTVTGAATVTDAFGQAPTAVRMGGGVTAFSIGDPDTLDPGATYSTNGIWIAAATQRALLRYAPDDPLRAVPDLAASMPVVSDDRRTVTVSLRSAVRFSPPVNRAVTSADVKYAIERGFFRSVATPYAATYFGALEGARAGARPGTEISGLQTPDDRTLVMRFTRPAGAIAAAALSLPLSAPVPPELAGPLDARRRSGYATRQVATGPYMIASDASGALTGYRPNRSIRLVRNPSWDRATDERPALLDTITINSRSPHGATSTILEGPRTISVDFYPPPRALRRAVRRHRDQTATVTGSGVNYTTLNTRLAPFDDIDVRRAVAAGFDRFGVRKVLGGRLTGPIATHFLPPGMPGHAQGGGSRGPARDVYADPHGDLGAAARFLRRAGYASGRFHGRPIVVAAPNDTPLFEAAGRFQARQFERLGFDVRLRLAPFNEIFGTICGRPASRVHVCAGLGWFRDFPDPQTILDPLFNGANIVPRSNSNVSQLDVPAINRAMRDAALAIGADARGEAWGRIDRMVTRRAAAIPLTWPATTLLRSADVAGVVNPVLGFWDPVYTGLAP
jgi:peptide/nickel transport system substrate-binding protein